MATMADSSPLTEFGKRLLNFSDHFDEDNDNAKIKRVRADNYSNQSTEQQLTQQGFPFNFQQSHVPLKRRNVGHESITSQEPIKPSSDELEHYWRGKFLQFRQECELIIQQKGDENKLLKRAVAIQDSRLKEIGVENQQLQHSLREAVNMITNLERQNAMLLERLRFCELPSTFASAMPPPDVF